MTSRAAGVRALLDDAASTSVSTPDVTSTGWRPRAGGTGIPGAAADATAAVAGGWISYSCGTRTRRASGSPARWRPGTSPGAGRDARCVTPGALLSVNDRAISPRPPAPTSRISAGRPAGGMGASDHRRRHDPRPLRHCADEVDAAAANPLIDYFCTGPVWPTPKPGRPRRGSTWFGTRQAGRQNGDRAPYRRAGGPWFAIGGSMPPPPEVLLPPARAGRGGARSQTPPTPRQRPALRDASN